MAMRFRRNARTIWPAARFLLLVTTLLDLTGKTISPTSSLPESSEGFPSLAEAEFDWNADGAPDRFPLRAQKEEVRRVTSEDVSDEVLLAETVD